MDLSKMLDERLISFGLEVTDKNDAIQKVSRKLYEAGVVSDHNEYLKGVLDREKECETGVGNGIAIPHCKSDCVNKAAFTLIKLTKEVEWGSIDDKPVDYIIMLAAPNSVENVHLKMLSELAVRLMDEEFAEKLKSATNVEQIKRIF